MTSEQQIKPHLSASQLEMFGKCPEQWRRRYIEKHVLPPGISILKGKAVHACAEQNFKQKIETHEDLPRSQIVEIAVADFEEQSQSPEFAFTAEEESRGGDVVIGEAVDSVADMASVHAQQQAPDYQPVHVEGDFRVSLPNSAYDIVGRIDLIDDRNIVADLKTAGKAKTQDDADSNVQLTVYSVGVRLLTGEPATELRYDTIVQTKTKTYRHVTTTQRGDGDLVALSNRINTVNAMIQAGVFPPTTPGAWWCGPKWCGYWRTCPYVNSQRAALADSHS